MKRIVYLFAVSAALFCSCQKEQAGSVVINDDAGKEMCFAVKGDGIDLDVQTKASPVTSLSKVYWECLSGSTVKYPTAQYNVSSGNVSTGKYWPLGGATYTYNVANVTFTNGVIAKTTAVNTTDVVVGQKTNVTSNSCAVQLDHIFCRTDTLLLKTQSGYTLSNVSWKIASPSGSCTGTAGKYVIPTGWSSTSSDFTLLAEKSLTGTVTYNTGNTQATLLTDEWLVPGTYTVTVSYKLTKGDYTSDTITKTASVALQQGYQNSITGTASGGAASQITFTVSVNPWTKKNISANFS